MKKIIAVFALALAVLVSAPPAEAQKGKVWRIGYLYPGTFRKGRVLPFRQELQKLGYVEGKNIVIEERYGEGRLEKIAAFAAEFVRLKFDVIVTHGSSVPGIADRAAKSAGRTIPIVMAVHADPVGTGVVASLARPGGNITGQTDNHSDLAAKRASVKVKVRALKSLKDMV